MNRMLIPLCMALLFPACGNEEWIKFQPIDFDVEGTTLAKNRNNHSFTGTIGAGGGTILFVANGKNASSGYLSEFCAEDTTITVHDADLNGSFPKNLLDRDWGRVDILANAPHSTSITLTPNENRDERHFRFTFGAAYTITEVELTQRGKE